MTASAVEAPARPDSPYKGLMPYTEADAAFFFGRDEDIEIVIANLLARRLTLLYGASGVGKSSLLGAGVVHRLLDLAHRNVDLGDQLLHLLELRGDVAHEDLVRAGLGDDAAARGQDTRST